MRITLFALLAGAAFFTPPAAAQAEPDVHFDGTWTATIAAPAARPQVSRLVLRQFSGTWLGPVGTAAGAKGACAGRKFPVTVQQSNASGLVFTVWGDAVAPTCANLNVELKPVSDRRFEGTVEAVGAITLVRR